MELHTGDVVKVGHGRYKLVNVLGQGDHSVVFEARDQRGEKVALKVSPDPVGQPTSHRRGAVTSPSSLVRVLETEKASDGFLTVMERIEGVDLRELCELLRRDHRCLAPRLAVDIIYQAARGLQDALTTSRQIHGDLKPANLMLDRRGTVKLLDYGINHGHELSASGKMPHDMGYLAPEQTDIEGQWADDPRSDLFALGAILYELVAGRPLYEFEPSDTMYQRLMTVARADVTRQLSTLQSVHPMVASVLHQALNRDPEERFQSGDEMAGVLANIASDLPPVMALDQFAEQLYDALREGRWSESLERSLPELGLERPVVVGQVRRIPYRELQEAELRANPPTLAPSATAPRPRDNTPDVIRLKRPPGLAMLAGMVLMLLVTLGLLLAFWRPSDIHQAIRSGAEAFSKSRPTYGEPEAPNPPPAQRAQP